MLWIIGLLTVVLVIDSLFLILLVLVQLPKKEAGIGQAFGGGATDALFGAGSGNALTKMTKYATGIFFALTMIIYLMYNHRVHAGAGRFATQIQEAGKDADSSSSTPRTPAAGTPSKPQAEMPLTTTNAPKVGGAASNATVGDKLRNLLTVPQAAPSSGTAPSPGTNAVTPPAPAK
jgi:protein translocase SecG subunit